MEIRLPELNRADYERAQKRLDNLTKPRGSLGYLEELAKQYVYITGELFPQLPLKKRVYVFAGDHGVVEEGVSAYPPEVTKQMIYNFLAGGAGINVIARQAGAEVFVVDVGVAGEVQAEGLIKRKVCPGTRNFLKEPAMSREEAQASLEVGFELACQAAEEGVKLLLPGEMGIGNTTPSAAVICALLGEKPEDIVGRGTGIDDEALKRKREVVAQALSRYKFDDPIDVLAKVGGAEIGAIAGLFLGGASKRVPVIIDGFISLAGYTIAQALEPRIKEFVFLGHCSEEKGAALVVKKLGLRPIVDLNLRLGEGTGACLASMIVETALRILTEMATFEDAGVTKGNEFD
ncbi:nicotinate-nucleotide--dimethylbenzimidazole phosphoribosyltransferase [Thermodesulfatator autotrophicus]|uniref:Nicotinate-nucleotide--dimethylbenzimidazole phosphoribosyltransferase n=1 Tax=Thermodesulfatator autotrophicus TaxID=1795632 RepID=A0A177E738_9BACT|nr:nicotinate-nucleotide--dimethylbenzimidazole phosphoribosyltransferase [Thermodesulfatator autotrophicus]OAG26829.1 nicotinate-nucleotide--dimethylbenzimidazole phosphoribosyltransferase [Thermodesulfatator autotrophicus]